MALASGQAREAIIRIGELAERTGVPARRLRYYEQQGLLSSGRSANGYRDYDPQSAERVTQIRGLIDAGIPTALIRDILPRLGSPGTIHVTGSATELIDALDQHREQLDARIQCISRNRDAIAEYIETIRAGDRLATGNGKAGEQGAPELRRGSSH